LGAWSQFGLNFSDALRLCRIREGDPASILFAIEKQGAKLIETNIALRARRPARHVPKGYG